MFTDEQLLKVETFLHDILPDNDEYNKLMTVLQAGYKKQLSGKLNVFYGTAVTGKSTLCKLIKYSFKGDAIYVPGHIFTVDINDDENEDYEAKYCENYGFISANKSFIISEGVERVEEKLDVAYIKQLIGGDIINVETGETESQTGELIFVMNSIPNVDPGMEKRMNVIHFNTRFVENPQEENEKVVNPYIFRELEQCTDAFRHLIENYVPA